MKCKSPGRLKPIQDTQSARISAHVEFSSPAEQRPPEFSLRYMQQDYCVGCCEKEEKAALADTLFKLSKLTWAQLRQSHRHGCGYEKIARDSIRASIPNHITDEVDLLAFRFSSKRPMVGYRKDSTFFILWLDRQFKLYKH